MVLLLFRVLGKVAIYDTIVSRLICLDEGISSDRTYELAQFADVGK